MSSRQFTVVRLLVKACNEGLSKRISSFWTGQGHEIGIMAATKLIVLFASFACPERIHLL